MHNCANRAVASTGNLWRDYQYVAFAPHNKARCAWLRCRSYPFIELSVPRRPPVVDAQPVTLDTFYDYRAAYVVVHELVGGMILEFAAPPMGDRQGQCHDHCQQSQVGRKAGPRQRQSASGKQPDCNRQKIKGQRVYLGQYKQRAKNQERSPNQRR